MKHRLNHFMKADMLASQFDALQEPSDAIVVDISPPPSAILAQILMQLPRPRPPFEAVQPRRMPRTKDARA
jgi:gluconate kinase